MSPEVVLSKIQALQTVLGDLRPHVNQPRREQERAHYEIERQVQLAADVSTAIARRILVLRGLPMPETAGEVFPALEKAGLIPGELARQLRSAVGLRNLIVHEYGTIDYDRFFRGLPDGYRGFTDFAQAAADALR